LAAGASSGPVNTSITIPLDTAAGSYYIIAKADADGIIDETNETNNTKSKLIKTGPDLIISAFTAPTISGIGKTISLTDTTKNQGPGAAEPSRTKYYLSSNFTYEAGDTYFGERSVPALPAGAEDTGSISVTFPEGTPTGAYYIVARSDADNTNPDEISETNNNKSTSIKIGPDLLVSALTAPSSAVRGSTISVTDTIRNQGGGDAVVSTTKLYLSVNSTYDVGDIYLGERALQALMSGATNTGSTNVTIPADLSAGIYYIIAVSDADGVVAETSETNNNRIKSITINP
jgi:subtilase family serine protease